MKGTFRSLANPGYRLWFAGAAVSNVGTWMQRIAQDWLVLTQLTPNSATAVGVIMALQFGPSLLLLPFTGVAADRVDRRRLLLATQAVQSVLALLLGLLTISGTVVLWHVYVLAFLLGCATAFDGPARQTFLADLVGEAQLANAVALNAASFNSARMIGPAVAGLLIATAGIGGVFLINAATYMPVLGILARLERAVLPRPPAPELPGNLGAALRYLAARGDMLALLFMLFLVATFGLNFPIFIATMTVAVFHEDVGSYGFLTSMMAIGSVAGALLTAHRQSPRIPQIIRSAAIFGLCCLLAALAPGYAAFAALLQATGVAAQVFTTSTNSLLQLEADPAVRGRVVSIVLAVFLGTTPIGSPAVGWVADTWGPRWALGVAAASGFGAALVGLLFCRKQKAEGDA
ncbi:MAG: putative transporter [Moraxellaceae bacterium]|nr:putative transporter [Moraxellaceae bacterium]